MPVDQTKPVCCRCSGQEDIQDVQIRHGFKTYSPFRKAMCAPCRKFLEHRWRYANPSKRKKRRHE